MTAGQDETDGHGEPTGGAVTVRVLSLGGLPLPDAVLTVTDGSGAQRGRVRADSEGIASAPELPPGRYTAIVTALGHQPTARTAVVRPGHESELGTVELSPVGGSELPEPGLWRIDPAHSSVRATARHLGITSIHGRFNEFEGHIRVARPVESSEVRVGIVASSVDTGNAQRDEHLRSADFLDVANHPEIVFETAGIRRRQDERWDLDGRLTLCGVTRPVRLETEFTGKGPDPWGGTRASATATTFLRREDFAMTFNQPLSTGIAAIGTTLRVDIDVQAVLAEPA
ncbi:YceI family protein [Actinopolyspora mortivallis]|uniref:YceI family protein n=1 Tax=Actinopolyspora mortivallis TaxID=33906 RepID=UPI0015E5CD97|nr:YceI family protein [Actinopolyspora mortivallis]